MKRHLYKALLSMHPPAFRRRFAAEMLWIFDESAGSANSLYLDCFLSFVRQWATRLGFWKVALAIVGASLQVVVGGLIWFMLTVSSKPVASGPIQDGAELRGLMQLILWGAGSMVVMVIITSLWLRRFTARRSHAR